MLVKVGSLVINVEKLSYIDLFFTSDDEGLQIGVELCFGDSRKYFWGDEAELLRWYFNHPTSKVKDIKNFKEG